MVVAINSWELGPAKANTASTSNGVHVPEGGRVEVGVPMEAVGTMGVEDGVGELMGDSLSSDIGSVSCSVEGTSTIPEVDGLSTVEGGRSMCDFDEAEGKGLAVGVGGGAVVEEVEAAAFFPLG